ncbi:EthD family reductase [Sphingomonas radiodurans]|uniref:EthD family reductase n=1 Tax=Sphingomonas radiodurans TaxID=2890321 RepID=UPI001E4ADA29|nr:EthD family reductase [Sphingomonas radiodurans]WBH17248.1 EthD family reductase [Sphingomonas radiodurans]
MIVSVIYPNHDGARFDADYYKATHAALAQELWNPDRIELIAGQSPNADPVPYALIAHFHFASPEALGQAMANPRNGELQADVPNFTDITPTLMMSRAL